MRLAEAADVPALVNLINAAYLVEAEIAVGDRIDEATAARMLRTPRSGFLLLESSGELVGAVYVRWDAGRGYFGPLAVKPGLQGSGIGRALVAAAEQHCRAQGASHLDLDVLSLRPELVAYYERLGFARTGVEPYPRPDRLRFPAELILMSKPLSRDDDGPSSLA